MCYFQYTKFDLYPENTSIHLGYQYQELGETDQQWRERAKEEKAMRDDLNRIRNIWKVVEKTPASERKAAERQSEYKPEPQTKYIIYTNPEPSNEIGAEHRKYWAIDTSPRPHFIAPGIIVEGTDSLEEAKYWRDYHESCG